MWFAGFSGDAIGWSLVSVTDDDSEERHRTAANLPDLLRLAADECRAGDGRCVAILDSTDGLLASMLLSAGIPVYRADRQPYREYGGAARSLALQARADIEACTRLDPQMGLLTGRADEFVAGIRDSAGTLTTLAREHRYFERGENTPGVALTFDDGPHPVFTAQILDILARYQVPATFFCVGRAAVECPGLVARAVAEGHLIANHSWSHPYLPDLSSAAVRWQITAASETLAVLAGQPVPASLLVRLPFGGHSPRVLDDLAELNLTIVHWDVDPADWRMPGAVSIADQVVGGAGEGSCVLLHDGGGDRSQTVAALPSIIERLRQRGHQLVRADDLTGASRDTPPAARAAGLGGARSPSGSLPGDAAQSGRRYRQSPSSTARSPQGQ